MEFRLGKYLDFLFPKKYKGHGKEQRIDNNVGIADAVHTEVCRHRQARYKKSVAYQAQHQPHTGEGVKVFALIDGHQGNQRKLGEDSENVGDALDAYVERGGVQNAGIGCHQLEHRLCKDQHDRGQHGVHTQGDKHTGADTVGKFRLILFYLADEIEQGKDNGFVQDLVQQVHPRELTCDREGIFTWQLTEEKYPDRGVDGRYQSQDEEGKK